MQYIPDDECEESGDDEDIVKHCKSNQQLVESFLELFPFHDADSEQISWQHDGVNDILERIDVYQVVLEHQQ